MLTFLSLIICYSTDKFYFFYCFTGLAYIDACKLTQDNICKAFDGNLWIMTKRTKTNVTSNIRLLDVPIEIITKYREKDKEGRLIPSCTNQKMNEYLKETPAV